MKLRPARIEDLEDIRAIFREYAELVADGICFQRFEEELAQLPGFYGPPEGGLFLAEVDGQLAGCVAFRKLTNEAAEMKRLYVRPPFRGLGLGRMLTLTVVEEARAAGYTRLCLDTLPRLTAAIEMYRMMGFREIQPYGDNPPSAICFEIMLDAFTTTGN